MDVEKLFNEFLKDKVITNKIELYNEAGLQFDFGVYLKEKHVNLKLEFERNVAELGILKTDDEFHKSEIDILINKR